MSDIAVRVEGIGKKYHIARGRGRYKTLRDTVSDAFSAPFRRVSKLLRGHAGGAAELTEAFWALDDVSFSVRRGEVIGIIGRNGAGKSTLLKILSRITEPTRGYAEIRGRVGSLLEVGTGFHPELTGRENIFLNGSILGMRRTEIERSYDEIVAFAEVEKFIETPVKYYSSGMYLRLAFAVAAHLKPEILIVDEVLAVGDADFQKKCLGKMQDVGKEGRTVLFVSHNMPAVTNLCERVILLDKGKVALDGPAHQVVTHYFSSGSNAMSCRQWEDPGTAPSGELARLRAVRVRSVNGDIAQTLDIREPVVLEMEYEVIKAGSILLPHFNVYNEEGVCLFPILDTEPEWRKAARPLGHYVSRATIPGNFLREGMLFVGVGLVAMNPLKPQFYEADTVAVHIIDSFEGDSARGDWKAMLGGVLRPRLQWTTDHYAGIPSPVSVDLEERKVCV